MIVRRMLIPIIKKQFPLFLTMILVSTISALVSISLTSTYFSTKNNLETFLRDYNCPDVFANVSFVTTQSQVDELYHIEGVTDVSIRWELVANAYCNERSVIFNIKSFNNDKFDNKFYFHSHIADVPSVPNIYVCKQFADKNNLKVGDFIRIGVTSVDTYINAHISAIITNPETLQAYPTNSSSSLNFKDFGFGFVNIKEIEKFLPTEQLQKLGNSVIIKTEPNANKKVIAEKAKNVLTNKFVEVTSIYTQDDNRIISYYYDNILKYLNIASVVVPILFFAISLALMFLFMYQIIRGMIREIGILNAIGVTKGGVLALMSSFSMLIGLISSILAVSISIPVSQLIYRFVGTMHNLPIGGEMSSGTTNPIVASIIVIALIIVSFLSSLVTIISIRKISPKDAINNDFGNKKPLPKCIEKLTKNSSPTLIIGLNTIRQNLSRFTISCFAILASFSMLFLSIVIDNTARSGLEISSNQAHYDSMIVQTIPNSSEEASNFFENVSNMSSVSEMERGLLCNNATVSFNGKNKNISITGIVPTNTMLCINDKQNKRCRVEDEAIVLEDKIASDLGVKINDVVTINGYQLRVNNISYIPFAKLHCMSFDTLNKLGLEVNNTAYVNVNNENDFTSEVLRKISSVVAVFPKSVMEQSVINLSAIFICAKILIAFAIILGVTTTFIMNKSSLNDQKRKYCIMRTVGFFTRDVGNISLIQTIAYFILGVAAGIPTGIFLSKKILSMLTNGGMTLEYNHNYIYYIFAIGIIFASLAVIHLYSLKAINTWNIAENTKSRE